MTQSNSESPRNVFNISNSSIENLADTIYVNKSAPKKVILFLAAQPIETARLRLDEEIREIEEGLKRSKFRDQFTLKQQWAVRPIDLRRALLDHKPQIVHFSGHGIGGVTSAESSRKLIAVSQSEPTEEGLILEDQIGTPKLVSTEALSGLFELFSDSVECVVLNACYSERQANAIAQHIPFVIGMQSAIGDRAAIEFSIGFYDALGGGCSVEVAYKLGCNSIQLAGLSEALTPTLFHS
jgi:CHAT domain-containing protein